MRLPRGMITLTCAGMLLGTKSPAGRSLPKEIACACASTTEIETAAIFLLSRRNPQRGMQPEGENGKRGLFALVPYGRGNAGQTAGLAFSPGYHFGRLKQESVTTSGTNQQPGEQNLPVWRRQGA